MTSSSLTQPNQTSSETLNFINFNQDGSCISIGTNKGYKIFNCEPFGKCFQRNDGGIGIVEMLFSTSLIAISGIGDQPSMSPRRLKIINTKRSSTICELTFPTTILSVKLNKSRLVVLLEEQIYIYDITTMRLLHTIETSPNINGLCALSPNIDSNFFAYPSPPRIATQTFNEDSNLNSNNNNNNNTNNTPNSKANNHNGDVIIFNAQTLQPTIVVEAHKSNLAAIAMSYDGTLLATASDKGTIVRVFQIETGVKLYQFRRGTYPTKIYSLSFSIDNRFLTACSSTETVHIFKLGDYSNLDNAVSADDLSDLPKPNFSRAESSGSETSYNNVTTANGNGRRRSSISSYDSINSGDIGDDYKAEPLVDVSRKTVARMIRKSSQHIGRRAAERIGTFLPPKLSSILEPTRHFASLKIPAANGVKNVVSIGKEIVMSKDGLPIIFSENGNQQDERDENDDSTIQETANDNIKLIHVLVVSSEGYFYNYGLDPERGGDCILLNQYSLSDAQ